MGHLPRDAGVLRPAVRDRTCSQRREGSLTDAGPTEDVLLRRRGALGRITLNRPRALNALTHGMVVRMREAVAGWERDDAVRAILIDGAGERALCAGGDIRRLHASGLARDGLAERFWHDEYVLDARIARCAKPVVAVMSGLVIGGGVGLTAHARHRVATESLRLSMLEVGIGLIPDVGATWLLSRLPGETGTYLALTGASVAAGDAIALGLADRFVPASGLADLAARLSDLPEPGAPEAIAKILDGAAREGPVPDLPAHRAAIDACFAFDTVEGIAAALARDGSGWGRTALDALGRHSPTSLKLTLAALRAARVLPSLEACLDLEYRLVCRILAGHDFYEGVRAAVLDKDRAPRWRPARLEAVPAETVRAYLDPRGAPTVAFP